MYRRERAGVPQCYGRRDPPTSTAAALEGESAVPAWMSSNPADLSTLAAPETSLARYGRVAGPWKRSMEPPIDNPAANSIARQRLDAELHECPETSLFRRLLALPPPARAHMLVLPQSGP